MTKKHIIAFAILAFVLAGTTLWRPSNTPQKDPQSGPRDHKNATYAIDGKSITLVDGFAEEEAAPGSAAKILTRYFGNEAVGDLDSDGMDDIGFILTQSGGGSGTFFYAAAALKTADGYRGTNAVFLGDRVAPQSTELRNGYLIVNYADRAQGEPMAAPPSIGKTAYLEMQNGKLTEAPVFIESPARDASVSSPLTVSGVARGPWYFEASFPLTLRDKNGAIITQSHATAQGEWMTTDYVPFSGTIEFPNQPAGTRGTLVFQKDNPSGLPEHDDARSIEIRF